MGGHPRRPVIVILCRRVNDRAVVNDGRLFRFLDMEDEALRQALDQAAARSGPVPGARLHLDPDPPIPGPEDGVVSRDAVLGAMAAMPPSRRACAVAVLPLELSTEEAADALGLTPATVRTEIHRARADLRRALACR